MGEYADSYVGRHRRSGSILVEAIGLTETLKAETPGRRRMGVWSLEPWYVAQKQKLVDDLNLLAKGFVE